VGCQTRLHRDAGVDVEARCEEAALAVLAGMGYIELGRNVILESN
jgi:hypothetical protein